MDTALWAKLEGMSNISADNFAAMRAVADTVRADDANGGKATYNTILIDLYAVMALDSTDDSADILL